MPDPIDTTKIPEMVKRIAMVIALQAWLHSWEFNGFPSCPKWTFDYLQDTTRQQRLLYEGMAEEILEALREPTADMRWKGQDAVAGDLRFVSPQDIYQAMINAALGR